MIISRRFQIVRQIWKMYRRVAISFFRSLTPMEFRPMLSKWPRSSTALNRSVIQPTCSFSCAIQKRGYSLVRKMGQSKLPKDMTRSEVESKVLDAVKKWDRFPSDRLGLLNLDARFVEDLGFDSLDHVEIIMSVEDEFNCEIPEVENEKFKTPNDIVEYFCKREDITE